MEIREKNVRAFQKMIDPECAKKELSKASWYFGFGYKWKF
jgi:hypothetical protein